jgi:branched-chain amino acid transport system permease protein
LQVAIIGSAMALFCSLFLFMKKARLGKAMRAVADNKDVAEVAGISSERIYRWTFVIASAMAGVAGVLVGLEQNLQPTMGTNLIIRGFTGAVIGGISSVPGAILGSFILGLVENFGIWFLPSGYKDGIAFLILFIFLLFRPEGLLGRRRGSV